MPQSLLKVFSTHHLVYLTARLGASFLGNLDGPQVFAWLDALWSQH